MSKQAVEEARGDYKSKHAKHQYEDHHSEVYQWKAADWGDCVGHCNYGTVIAETIHFSAAAAYGGHHRSLMHIRVLPNYVHSGANG